MSKYVSQMASTFDGFRLDNAHSTPLHVCQYLLQVARCHNKNLFVMAELFTPSAEFDALFVRKLNINGMIRELQNREGGREIGTYFHHLTCQEAVLGGLDRTVEDVTSSGANGAAATYHILKPEKPSDIIYDMTHDNEAPLSKFKTRKLALPTMGLNSLADQAIASTWGYDQLLPQNLCVVRESRLYPIEKSTINEWWPHGEKKIEAPQKFPYTFKYYNAHCSRVAVAGEFNAWQPTYELKKRNSHEWSATFDLEPSGDRKV